MKKTEWIPCTTKPVHKGVYEFRCSQYEKPPVYRARWNGAEFQNEQGKQLAGIYYCPDRYEWRGLAGKPA